MHPSTPTNIPSVQEYLTSLRNSPKYGPQVVCHKIYEKTQATYSADTLFMEEEIRRSLHADGIVNMYSHQGEAFEKIANGENVIVATPTSSGKSMVYNLPVLQQLLKRPHSRALYLFPLKALAQDQLAALNTLAATVPSLQSQWPRGIGAVYDGDTTPYWRRKIREHTPPVLITNPEMLHLSFLPFHENWVHFFKNLDFIIIDEVHTYRGVFGSHIAWLLRRLNRVLHHYGRKPIFILSSATIGNPAHFGQQLTGQPTTTITATGAPQNKRNFVFLNPWDSAAHSASQLLEAALKRGLRTIVYTQSRKMTELISLWTRPRLGNLADRLSSYRAGFLAEERRDIERQLSDGTLLGVISTSALELGIDIGDLDICILVGYPGSIMASWQRGGRVGRSGRESAVILIGSEDALDQYYMNNPQAFFSREVESAVLNPANATIVKQHMVCAAAEMALQDDETLLHGDVEQSCLKELVQEAAVYQSADGVLYYAARKRPQRHVSLRGGGTTLTIINEVTGVILGEIDGGRALKECHEGAIYLHRNTTWFVEKLDLHGGEVVVRRNRASFYTKPTVNKETEILSISGHGLVHGCRLFQGTLKVSERVTGYQKRNNGTNRLIATVPLDLPVQTMETEGFWLEIPNAVTTELEEGKHHFMGGLHAFEHILISVFPLLVLCDRNDVGGISCPDHEQTKGATIFIYDGHAGGSGLSAEAYTKADKLIAAALEIVGGCECDNGCPACVHSPKCGSGNRPIDKNCCLKLIEAVVSEKYGNSTKTSAELPPAVADGHPPAVNQQLYAVPHGLDLLPQRYGVFDLETRFSAAEVGGWHRAEKMEISVGVVYDSVLDGYVTYLENEIDQLVDHLKQLDLIVGFNNKRFDNRVLSAYTTTNLARLPTLDLLEEVTQYLGYRLSLNRLAEQTLGVQKSGDGLQALRWYKEGNLAMLRKYCRKDVDITRRLLLHALEQGFLLFRNKAGKTVRLPMDMSRSIHNQLGGTIPAVPH